MNITSHNPECNSRFHGHGRARSARLQSHISLLSLGVRISVVIPARNEEQRLPAQLDDVLEQKWEGEWEVLVVDNGSTDGTAAVVNDYATREPRVRYLRADAVADQSFAANAGVAATTDAVVFCDAEQHE